MIDMKIVTETGQGVSFPPSTVEPLVFSDIPNKSEQRNFSRKMTFHSINATIDGVRQEGDATIIGTISFNEVATIYALVPGGWLPPPFVVQPHFLVDRNVVSAMKQIRSGQLRQDSMAFAWWMQLFEQGVAAFDPICFAIEGGRKELPTIEELKTSLEEGRVTLESFLPDSTILRHDEKKLQAAWRLIEEIAATMPREVLFLKDVAPLLAEPVSSKRLIGVEKQIRSSARARGVLQNQLVFIAALSCLYGGGDRKST